MQLSQLLNKIKSGLKCVWQLVMMRGADLLSCTQHESRACAAATKVHHNLGTPQLLLLPATANTH
jgi:hypothetical protein